MVQALPTGEIKVCDLVYTSSSSTKGYIYTIDIKYNDDFLYGGVSKYVTNYTIDSKCHHLETKEQYKIAIDPFDDKGIRNSNRQFRFYQ